MIRLAVCVTLVGVVMACKAVAAGDGSLVFDAKSVGGPNSGAPIELWRPAGTGPFPAMVVLHGCNGVGIGSRGWAARLAGWGYVAAIVDSFRPRKFEEVCDVGWPHAPAIKVYPGAVHGFDVAGLARFSASHHLMRENPEAAADSFAMAEAFLAARPKPK